MFRLKVLSLYYLQRITESLSLLRMNDLEITVVAIIREKKQDLAYFYFLTTYNYASHHSAIHR